ncbi:MAG: penicillin-binding protein 1A [Rhodospirillales bacterium]|nr:penicillin-binding protein 1A [Rhodospirillales bacterium]
MARPQTARGRKAARPASSRSRRPSLPARLVLFTAKWTAIAAIWGIVAVTGVAAFYAYDLPDIDAALEATRQPTVTFIAADGTTLATVGEVHGAPVRLADLPASMPNAVLAIEDRRFRDHFGLDVIGLARAFYVNARAGRVVQGGSTITQQVAKNLFLTPERSIKRKVQEVLLALWLEQRFSKDQILTLYLNRVYLGAGTYGVDAAARRYFGHRARDLTVYESAMLAGLLKAPSRFNPANDPEKARERARVVLAAMVDAGYLSATEAERAAEVGRGAVAANGPAARYFTDWLMEQVSGFVAPGDSDLMVFTTLDPLLQAMAERAVREALGGPAAGLDIGQAALVAMAPDGAVRAMVGGRDYGDSQFNRATQALRQPGSAFKPIVFLAGLEAGLTPDSRLMDAPITIDGWTPGNFDDRFMGEVSMTQALARSLNTVSVRVAQRAGPSAVVATARRLGITSPLQPTLDLALGTGEVTLTELTSAFAAFANGGRGVWSYGIREIRDSRGAVLYRRAGSGPGPVTSAAHVAAMNRMLERVLTEGTGKAAALDRPAAGKTGTSQNFRDAWFVGYTPQLVAGVWMGNDNGAPMRKVSGSGLPAKVWQAFMTAAHRDVPVHMLPDGGGEPAPSAPQDGFWSRLLSTLGIQG